MFRSTFLGGGVSSSLEDTGFGGIRGGNIEGALKTVDLEKISYLVCT